MNKGIFVTLFDSKTEKYTNPTAVETNEAAIRQFGLLVNDDRGTLVSLHPEDFSLFRIGSFEDYTIVPEPRFCLANGIDVKRPISLDKAVKTPEGGFVVDKKALV